MIKRYKEKIKKHIEEVLKIKTSPRSLALGFAIGTAIALLPTFGLGPLIGLLIILIFKKISKISLFAALAIWNPLVLVIFYAIAYKLGNWILTDTPTRTYNFWFLDQIFNYSRRFLVGNLIVTVSLTIISYIVVYFLARKYQKKYKALVEHNI